MTTPSSKGGVLYLVALLSCLSLLITSVHCYQHNVQGSMQQQVLQPASSLHSDHKSLMEKLASTSMHEGVPDDSTSSRSSRQGSDAGSEDGTPIISSGPFNIKDKLYSAIGKSLLGTDNYEAFKRSKVKYSMEVHYMDANPYVDFNGGGDSGSGKPSLTLNMGWPITKASSSPANNMLVKLPFSTPEEQDRIELELPTLSLASAPIYTLTFPLSVAMTPSSQLSGNRFVVDYYHSKKLYSSSADIEPDFIGVWQFNNKGAPCTDPSKHKTCDYAALADGQRDIKRKHVDFDLGITSNMFNSLPIEITTAPRCFRKIQRSFDGPSLYEFNVLECGMAGGDFRNYYDNQKRFLVMLCKSNLVMSGAQCVRAVQLNVKEPRGQLSERNQETEMSLTVKAQFKDPETDESVLGVNFDINAFVSANSKVSVLGGDENRYGVTLDFRTFTPDETETDSFYQMPKVSDIMLTQRTDSYCTIRCFLRQLYINFLPEVMEKRKDDSLSHNLYTVHPDWNDVSNVLCTIPKKDEAFVMRDLCQEAKTACGHKAASLDDSTNGGFAETTTLFSSFGFQDCADLAGSKDIAAAKLAYKNRVLRSLKDLGLSEDYISQQWLKSKEWADKVQSSIKNGETPLTLLGIRENNLQLNGKASKEEAECIAKSLEYAWYMHERVREKKIRRKVITTVKRWRCNPFELASGQDREDHCFLSLGECHALPYNPDSPASLLLGADEKICNHMTEVECRSTDRDCGWFWNVNFDLSQRHKHPFVKMSYDGPPGIVNALANAGIGAIGMGANTVVKSVKFILRDHWKRIISDSVKYVKRDNAEKTSIDDSIKSASTDEATVNVNLQGDKSSYFNVNLFDHRLMTANMLLNTKDKTSNLINDVWHEHISRGYNLDLAAYLGNNEDQRVSAQLFVKKFDSDLISLFTAAINDVNRISNVGFELPDPIPLLPPVTLTEENLERRDQLDEEPPSEQLAASDVDSVLTGEDRADGNERQSFVSLNSRTTLSMKVAAVANTPEMIKGKDSYKIRAEIVRSDVIKHSVLQRLLSFDGALETNSAEQRTGFLSLLNSRPRDDCAVLDSMDKWQEECLQKDSGLTPKPDATKSKIFRVESSHPKALDMMLPLAVTGSENVPTLFVENYFIRVSIIRRANKLARKMTDNTKAVALVNLLEVYRRIKDNCGDDDSTWKYQGTDCSTSLVVDGVDARDGFKKTMKIELDITFFFKQKSMSAGVAIKDGSPIDIKGSSNIDIRDVDNNEGLLSSLKIQDWLYFSELQVPSVNSKISVSIGRGDDLCSTLVGGNKARGSLCDIKGKLSSAQGTQQQRHQVTIRMSKTHIDLSVRIHTKASVAGITLKKINTEIVHLILTLDSAEMIVQPETMDEKNLLRCMCESSTKCPFDTQPSDTGDNTDSPVLLNAAVNTKGLKVRMKSPSHIMLNSKNIKAFINQFEGGLDSLLKSKVVLRALFQGSQIDTSGGCFDKLSQEVTSVSGYSVPLFMGLMRLDRVLGVRMSEALLESEPALVAIDEVENAMEGKPIKSKKKGMFSKAAKKVRQRLADMQEKIVALKAVTVPQDEEEDEESLMDGTSHGLGVDEDGELIRQIPYDNPLSIRLELDIDHMKLGHEQSLELPHVITNIAELLVSAGYETQIPGIKTTEVEE